MEAIGTERLRIRNFAPADWSALQALIVAYQTSEIARFEPPWPTSDEEIQGIAAWFAGADDYLAVCLRDGDALIGLVAVERRSEDVGRMHNLGYIFHPRHQGQGYATEACQAAMRFVFERCAADGIHTGTHPDNRASVSLLARIGLREIGAGEFALTREEWLAQADH